MATTKMMRSIDIEKRNSRILSSLRKERITFTKIIELLSEAPNIQGITSIFRETVRELTKADGATFVLRKGDQCCYVEEDAISPLWKGQNFPMNQCISGWVMLNRQSVIIEDIYKDSRIPVGFYRSTFIKSMLMVPIRHNNPLGAIGIYWAAPHVTTQDELSLLEALANATCTSMENVSIRNQITSLENHQKKLSEQKEILKTFSHALAHDLKEGVRSINFMAEMGRQEENALRESLFYHESIQKISTKMGNLISSILDYIKLENPAQARRTSFSISNIIETVRQNLTKLISERKALITTKDLFDIYADYDQVVMVFQNIIANAIKHNKTSVKIEINMKDNAEEWLFSIRDNGVGIPEERLTLIYNLFTRFTTDFNSSGIGLSLCQKIIELHKGKLWCESQIGRGCTFYFTLPKETSEK